MRKKALVVFAKAPETGNVKTRLQSGLGRDKTIEVYKSFIQQVLKTGSNVRGVDRYLACAPSDKYPFLRSMARRFRMETFPQRGKDLGRRIVNGFNDCFRRGYRDVVIIGSDSPTIPHEYISLAFKKLNEHRFVIGPCCDGGMYLVGAREEVNPRLFQGVPWDTSDVLMTIMEKCFRSKRDFTLLPFWYDVDDLRDYQFLKLHIKYLSSPSLYNKVLLFKK